MWAVSFVVMLECFQKLHYRWHKSVNVVFIVFAAEGTECKTPAGVPAGDVFSTQSSHRQQPEVGNQVNLLHVLWRNPVEQQPVQIKLFEHLVQYIKAIWILDFVMLNNRWPVLKWKIMQRALVSWSWSDAVITSAVFENHILSVIVEATAANSAITGTNPGVTALRRQSGSGTGPRWQGTSPSGSPEVWPHFYSVSLWRSRRYQATIKIGSNMSPHSTFFKKVIIVLIMLKIIGKFHELGTLYIVHCTIVLLR